MRDNIPTVYPNLTIASTRAVFTVQDVKNSFEQAIQKQYSNNFQQYQQKQLNKRV